MEFRHIKDAVAVQFGKMAKHELFCTGVEKDDLGATYLASFPAGTNPLFRKRTEHDCSCCQGETLEPDGEETNAEVAV